MASTDVIGGGNIEPRALEEEMRTAYLDYAMSVIVGRALPDVRDGLKPVHRRVLYAMNELGLGPTRPFSKCAKIVGEVMGNYHPHGDSAIYDTLVRMAQDFSMRYMLVEGQGNFGSVDDDPPAAMRYTEAKLSRIATEMLRDLDADTVDFVPNYNNERREPLVLPSRFPNLLVNGSSGIAVGMATNIPPHNLREVIAATIAYIDDPQLEVEGLMRHIKGPDFPTGGIILGRAGIRDAYETGRGRVRVQARAHIEPLSHGKEAIVVTELPFMVKKGGDNGLMVKIKELVDDKKITEISDLRDESDKRGMRLVIELKRDALPKVVLNKLYKHTSMQTTFGVNMVALVDNVPRTLDLRAVIHNYVAHQRDVIVRRTKHELSQKEARAHILEGLLIALDNLDAIIELIRGSRDRDTAREQLVVRFELSHIQATAILDLRLSQLTALEADSVKTEHADVTERIRELRDILGDESRVLSVIKEELTEIADRFGDERRTEITHSEDEIDIEDLIADQQMVITITHSGYIKSLPLATYRQQHRGGRGHHRDGHEGRGLHRAPVHHLHARLPAVHHQPREDLPLQGVRPARGPAHGEGPRAREHPPAARGRARAVGALHARLHRGQVPHVRHPQGDGQEDRVPGLQHADQGRRHHRHQDQRRRRARGRAPHERRRRHPDGLPRRQRRALPRVRRARRWAATPPACAGMNVSQKGNSVLAMDVARDDQELLVVTENGYGKRSSISEYRKTKRGAMGVKTITLTDRKGGLAGALVVREHEELVFISSGGMVQRTGVRGINRYGRASQGVRVMNLKDDDVVSAIALIVENDEDTAAPVRRGPAPRSPKSPASAPNDAPPARVRHRLRAPLRLPALATVAFVRYSGRTRERRWS